MVESYQSPSVDETPSNVSSEKTLWRFFPRDESWMSVYKLNLSVEGVLDTQPLSLDEVDSLRSRSVELRFQAASRTMISSELNDIKPALPLRPKPLQCDPQQLKT